LQSGSADSGDAKPPAVGALQRPVVPLDPRAIALSNPISPAPTRNSASKPTRISLG